MSRAKYTWEVFKKLQVFEKSNYFPALLYTISQVVLACMDLVAVGLLGVATATASSEFTRGQPGNISGQVIEVLRLSNLDAQTQVIFLGLLAAALLIGKTILSTVVFRAGIFYVAKKTNQLSTSIIQGLFDRPVEFLSKQKTQREIWVLTSGVTLLSLGVYRFLLGFSADMLLLLILFGGLVIVDWVSAVLVLFLFTVTSVIAYRYINEKSSKLARERSKVDIQSAQTIFEATSILKELRVRNQVDNFISEIVDARRSYSDTSAKLQFLQSISKYMLEIISVLAVIALGVYVFSVNDISRGVALLTLFLAGSSRIMPAILRLQNNILNLRISIEGAQDTVSAIHEAQHRVKPERQTTHTNLNVQFESISKHAIIFNDITFGFQKNKPLVQNLFLEVQEGEFFGITGKTGSGKSSILDLMLGFRQPIVGNVRIFGQSPNLIFRERPGLIGFVPQEIALIEGSLRRNITLSRELKSEEDSFILGLIKNVGLEEILERVGLDETIQGNELTLSGGQRQRLGIVRSLYTRPRLLFLDEATSALDVNTEGKIIDFLKSQVGLAIVLVTHRVDVLRRSDRMLYLGKVDHQIGTFASLMSKSIEFRSYWETHGNNSHVANQTNNT